MKNDYRYPFWATTHDVAKLIAQLEKSITAAPKGFLRESSCKGIPQFYHATTEHLNGVYLNRDHRKMAEALAQKSYDKSCLAAAKSILDRGVTRNGKYCLAALDTVYAKLSPARQNLVQPYILPQEEFLRQWEEEEFDRFPLSEDGPRFITETGVEVRSKSELMTGDIISHEGLLYRYEWPLYLRNQRLVRPDFLILDPWLREEVVYEHFGMMGDTGYQKEALGKINDYIESGFLPGINFLYSLESSSVPFDNRAVKAMLHTFFQKRKELYPLYCNR